MDGRHIAIRGRSSVHISRKQAIFYSLCLVQEVTTGVRMCVGTEYMYVPLEEKKNYSNERVARQQRQMCVF